jgi:uncharacterized protein
MTDAPPPPQSPQNNPYSSGPGTPQQPLSPQDEKLWSTLVHVGGIFLNFISPLIGYLLLKDRGPFVAAHTKTALNFQITLAIAYVAGLILSVIGIGALIALAAWVLNIVFSIIAALAANKGEMYKYPIAINFIK